MTEVKKREFKSVQQPLIVRRLMSKPGEYELIDGYGRFALAKDEQTDRTYNNIKRVKK